MDSNAQTKIYLAGNTAQANPTMAYFGCSIMEQVPTDAGELL